MLRSVRAVPIAILALLAGGAGVAEVSGQALEILQRSIMAEGSVNFSGMRTVVVFEDGTKVQGYQQTVYEKAPGKLRMVVVAPEDQRGRLVVSNGEVQWQYLPDKERAVRRRLPSLEETRARRLADLQKLARDMSIQYLGVEEIAGRQAHVVCVCSDGGAPLKKHWIDTEQLVTLKTHRFDTQGRVKLSMYYTAINFQPSYADGMFDFTPPEGCSVREASDLPERLPLEEAEARAEFDAVLPSYLPRGYGFQSDRVSVIPMRGKMVLWLTFSNGADTFSIFQRRRGLQLRPREQGRFMDWTAGQYAFTLVGQLSCAEMLKIRESINP